MSSILNYVDKYQDYSFISLPFNELDNVILSSVSYLDFDGILTNIKRKKISMEEVGKIFFKKYSKKELANNIMGVLSAIKIFKAIYQTKRYKDLLLYNYVYKSNASKQFSAVFIDIDKKTTFVSFEGTDDLISGWREDAELSYNFPVEAQKDAIKYINKTISILTRRKYIIGGHSKGGNLALVAGMYANPLIQHKIKKIYSNDGVGLLKEQIESSKYKKIEYKFEHIIPNYSVVGLLLFQPDNYTVVLANKKGLMAHNVLSWQVDDCEFIRANLSSFSKNIDEIITKWLDSYNMEERKKVVEDFFNIMSRAGVNSLLDIKISAIPSIIKIIKEAKKMDETSKKVIIELVTLVAEYLKEDATKYLKDKLKI